MYNDRKSKRSNKKMRNIKNNVKKISRFGINIKFKKMITKRFSKENFKLYKKLESEGFVKVNHKGNYLYIELLNINKISNVSKPKRRVYNN
jgi:ribosomal protein S8